MVTIEDAIECFGDELPSMRVTERDALQAVRPFSNDSDAEILERNREYFRSLGKVKQC